MLEIDNRLLGQYTLIAAGYTKQPTQDDPLAGVPWVVKQITIQKDGELELEMAFE